jgi:hypothetical protein
LGLAAGVNVGMNAHPYGSKFSPRGQVHPWQRDTAHPWGWTHDVKTGLCDRLYKIAFRPKLLFGYVNYHPKVSDKFPAQKQWYFFCARWTAWMDFKEFKAI